MAASMHTPEVDNSIPYALHVHACSNAYYIYIYTSMCLMPVLQIMHRNISAIACTSLDTKCWLLVLKILCHTDHMHGDTRYHL